MSIRVVTESHQWGDEYDYVPSSDEFEALEATVRKLGRKVSAVQSSLTSIERLANKLEKSLSSQKSAFKALKKEMVDELKDGEWRSIIAGVVKEAVSGLDVAMSNAGAQKSVAISKLVERKLGLKSDKLNATEDIVKSVSLQKSKQKRKKPLKK